MHAIYSYMPETNHVFRVHNVVTILWLMYMVRVMLFSLIKCRTFTLALFLCKQYPVLFFSSFAYYYYYYIVIIIVWRRTYQVFLNKDIINVECMGYKHRHHICNRYLTHESSYMISKNVCISMTYFVLLVPNAQY
jgi:hypothetical protein